MKKDLDMTSKEPNAQLDPMQWKHVSCKNGPTLSFRSLLHSIESIIFTYYLSLSLSKTSKVSVFLLKERFFCRQRSINSCPECSTKWSPTDWCPHSNGFISQTLSFISSLVLSDPSLRRWVFLSTYYCHVESNVASLSPLYASSLTLPPLSRIL